MKTADTKDSSSAPGNGEAGQSFAPAPCSVREVAVVMGALLRKHGVIDAAAIDDPEGYDNYDTLGRLLRVAEDWCEWYSQNAPAQRPGDQDL